MVPSAALSFNIANAYEKSAQPAAALRWYRDYLRRAPDAADRAQVEITLRGLEQSLENSGIQQLTVTTVPPGAALTIDGQPIGVTPWTGELAPGSHALDLRAEGYAPGSRGVELPARKGIQLYLLGAGV